jgi:hypothetical protein
MQKKLQKDSEFAKYDLNGDGVVSDEELAMEERMIDLDNKDKKEDAQRNMAWFSYQLCLVLNKQQKYWVIWQEFTSLPLLVLLQRSSAHRHLTERHQRNKE